MPSNQKDLSDNGVFSHVIYLQLGEVSLVIPFVSKPDADFYINGLLSGAKKHHNVSFQAMIYDIEGIVDTIIYPPKTIN